MNTWPELDPYYINLASRPDRNQLMIEELTKAELPVQRFEALRPEDYKGPPERIAAMLARPQKGAIGCHFSQMAVAAKALETGRPTLVLEDDCVFCDDFQERLGHFKQFLDTRYWDIAFLGGTYHVNPPVWHRDTLGKDVERTEDTHILRTYGIWSTYAWIVNPETIGDLLKSIDSVLPQSWGIDHLLIGIQPELTCYCFVPGCVRQRDGKSDIGVDSQGRKSMTIFSNFSTLGPYWFTEKLSDFDPTTFNWAEANRE